MRVGTLAGLMVVALALVAGAPADAAERVASSGRVQADVAESGRSAAPSRRPVLPLRPSSEQRLRAAKDAAARRRGAAERDGRSPRVGVVGGLNQPGMDAEEGGGATPPDTTGAIGPNHYVQMVNVAVSVYTRASLSRVAGPVDLETFMDAPPGTSMTDPQVQWDQQGGRWFYVGLAFTTDDLTGELVGPNFLQYGFSKTSDPSNLATGWCRYSFENGTAAGQNLLDDYPKLGHGDAHVAIGTNVFNEDEDFLTARIWALPKPAAGALTDCPAAPVATTFGSVANPLLSADGDTVFTPVPANTGDSSPVAYVVAADDPLETGLPPVARDEIMAWHVGGTATTPALIADANIAVEAYNVPPPALQPGPSELDTLDGRLTMAVAHRDPDAAGQAAVWTQHTVDEGDGIPVMRWYELLPASDAARQQGTISDAANDVYNGAVSPGTSGSFAAFFYNVSGPTLAPQIRARARGPATPLNDTTGETLLGTSAAPAADLSCAPPFGPPCRWGDYSGASPDHSNPTVVWGSNQAVGPPLGVLPSWVTRNFAFGGQPPSASFTVSPATPQAGQPATFTSTSSDRDDTLASHTWDLDGDGGFDDASGSTVSRAFPQPGTFTVALRVADSLGLTAIARQAVRVVQGASAPFEGCPGASANLIRGTSVDNSITGTAAGDRIFAGTGNDVVDGLAGDDCIDLGPGTDRGQGGLGADLILGGLGADRIAGSSGNDRLRGNSGNDRLNAGRGNDRGFGDAGNDRISGSFGDDRLHGVSGTDRISGSRGRDRINGGSGRDAISGGSSGDRISGDAGSDRINGNSGNDRIRGNSSSDRLAGGAGRDAISGGSGNDRIHSRDGRRDRINCGRGRDSVIADRIDLVSPSCERVSRR